MAKRNNKKNLPTTVELFQGTRSGVAYAAIFRSGGGAHQDRRTRRQRTRGAQRRSAMTDY